jgi:hypothetical protein
LAAVCLEQAGGKHAVFQRPIEDYLSNHKFAPLHPSVIPIIYVCAFCLTWNLCKSSVFFNHKEAGFLASLLKHPHLLTTIRQMTIASTIFIRELQIILTLNEQENELFNSFIFILIFKEMLQKAVFLTFWSKQKLFLVLLIILFNKLSFNLLAIFTNIEIFFPVV